jgi:two-component system, OmpR family, KDP operon response regulator KdpE
MSGGQRVLVVDDDPAILRSVRANLAVRGYAVLTADSGEAALDLFDVNAPDLVILDLMLPGASGLDVCRTIRATAGTPILVLSARGEERTKVRALDLGADDYLTKPFGMDELMARVRALLRRPGSPAPPDGMLLVGDLSIDLATRHAVRGGAPLELTAREFDVLAYMMRYAGKVVTHRLLLEEVWGPEYRDSVHYLRVFINRLRRKIEDDPSRPTHIVTEPGVGYRILPGSESA